METNTAPGGETLTNHRNCAILGSKLFRISVHLTCLLVQPLHHAPFHVSGLAREFRF